MASLTTSFEDSVSANPAWTPLVEEEQFLTDVMAQTPRIYSKTIGQSSVQAHPIKMYAIGYPDAPTDAELRDSSNILVTGCIHGKEPSGREAALQMIRDLAFTTDPTTQEYLRNHPVIIVPTMNPEGFPNVRENDNGEDLNRHWVSYSQLENQAIGTVTRDYNPHIVFDFHEYFSRSNQFEMYAAAFAEVHPQIGSLGTNLVTALRGDVGTAGYTTALFPDSTDARFMSNSGAMLNTITILVECRGQGVNAVLTFKEAVDGCKVIMNSAFVWHEANLVAVRKGIAESALEVRQEGEDLTAISHPAISSPPKGYTLSAAQLALVSASLDFWRIKYYELDTLGSYYIPMAQEKKKLLPHLLDSRSAVNVISATPVDVEPALLAPIPRLVNFRWKKQSSADLYGAWLAVDSSELDVVGLESSSTYEWSAQSQEVGTSSPWSTNASFTTLAGADPAQEATYNLEWRDVATLTVTPVFGVVGESYELTGLSAGEDYEFRVQEVDGTNQSAWSAWSPFTTQGVGVDSTPDPFTVAALTNQPLSTNVEFAPVTVSGVDEGVDITVSVTGTDVQYSVDTGAGYGGFTSTSTNVQLGYLVKARILTSSSNSTQKTGTLSIGGESSALSATTEAAAVITPDPETDYGAGSLQTYSPRGPARSGRPPSV